MRDIDMLFLVLTLFNTGLGMSNFSKNTDQRKNLRSVSDRMDVIDHKLDEILEAIKDERKTRSS